MTNYLFVIEPTSNGFSAYCPDLPGLACFGETEKKLEKNIEEGVEFHLEGLKEDNEEVPPAKAYARNFALEA